MVIMKRRRRKIVLQFHGDFWHENPTKNARKTINPESQVSMDDLYDRTLEKSTWKTLDILNRCIEESDLDKQMEEDSTLNSFIKQLDIVMPLETRYAFLEACIKMIHCVKTSTIMTQRPCIKPFVNILEKAKYQ